MIWGREPDLGGLWVNVEKVMPMCTVKERLEQRLMEPGIDPGLAELYGEDVSSRFLCKFPGTAEPAVRRAAEALAGLCKADGSWPLA